MTIVSEHGALPYILFKKNSTIKSKTAGIWRAMYQYYRDYREEFLAHYHLRSNAESVFSMMKRKQGVHLRSKNDIAQINEVLCKALVHNVCVLIQEMFESGIKVDFEALAEDELMCKTLP